MTSPIDRSRRALWAASSVFESYLVSTPGRPPCRAKEHSITSGVIAAGWETWTEGATARSSRVALSFCMSETFCSRSAILALSSSLEPASTFGDSTATLAGASIAAATTGSSMGDWLALSAMVDSCASSAAIETAVLRSAPKVTKEVSRSVEARTTRTGPTRACPFAVVDWSSPNFRCRPTSAPTLACHW